MNPQQTNPKTQLRKPTTVSKTQFCNKSNITALTRKCLFKVYNKKVREINNSTLSHLPFMKLFLPLKSNLPSTKVMWQNDFLYSRDLGQDIRATSFISLELMAIVYKYRKIVKSKDTWMEKNKYFAILLHSNF